MHGNSWLLSVYILEQIGFWVAVIFFVRKRQKEGSE